MLDYAIILQAGGKSTRMGTDKGLVPFMGTPMLEYVYHQIAGLNHPTIIITQDPAAYAFLGLPCYEDVIKDWGALGGLYSALVHSPAEYAIVLACDMPFVNLPLLDHMLALAPDWDAVVPRLGERGFAEPFRGIYRRTCLEPIRAAIDAGQRRVISFFDDVRIRFVDQPEIEKFDPDLRSFFNVNTPEDLEQAQMLTRKETS